MEIGFVIVFWYGVLHAFGPDHLMVIANFSIGKKPKQAFVITLAFALGHGLMLFVFSKLLKYYVVSEELLTYGDLIASSVIVYMGAYLLYMVYTNKVHLRAHMHRGEDHIHIWLGEQHEHSPNKNVLSAYTLGMLMGISGVRGMLVSLGVIEFGYTDVSVVSVFVMGVGMTFAVFGIIVSFINKSMLMSQKHVRRIFTALGMTSIVVGSSILIG